MAAKKTVKKPKAKTLKKPKAKITLPSITYADWMGPELTSIVKGERPKPPA